MRLNMTQWYFIPLRNYQCWTLYKDIRIQTLKLYLFSRHIASRVGRTYDETGSIIRNQEGVVSSSIESWLPSDVPPFVIVVISISVVT